MVITRRTIEDFRVIKQLTETILPTNTEEGMELQMRLDSFLEDLTNIHESVLDNQRNQYEKRRRLSESSL